MVTGRDIKNSGCLKVRRQKSDTENNQHVTHRLHGSALMAAQRTGAEPFEPLLLHGSTFLRGSVVF